MATTEVEHQVWGRPKGKPTSIMHASYTPERWQWALKLKSYLEDVGCFGVTIKTVKVKSKEPSGTNKPKFGQ